MNNYCRNCGEKLELNEKFCLKCGVEVFENRVDIEAKKKELEDYKRKETTYITVVLVLFSMYFLLTYFSSYYDFVFFNFLKPLLILGICLIIIYARITMSDSVKIKIMFNIFLVLIILAIIYFSILIAFFSYILRGCFQYV